MYMDKKPVRGYNPYMEIGHTDCNTGMDVGLLVMEEGDIFELCEAEKEVAVDLLEGKVVFAWDDQALEADRPDTFHYDAYCLHVCKGSKISIKALNHAELYIQKTYNDRTFDAKMYTKDNMLLQQAGKNGELMGCMRREIKTFFDYESAPWSNMVLGEVQNFPGKWSSYPPHHHPQPEIYFYRFDYPDGFGAGFANGQVYHTKHNGCLVINHSFHSQVCAPGYAMIYMWGIRHLPDDPWRKTRIDDPEHAWLWKPDANDHIFKVEE